MTKHTALGWLLVFVQVLVFLGFGLLPWRSPNLILALLGLIVISPPSVEKGIVQYAALMSGNTILVDVVDVWTHHEQNGNVAESSPEGAVVLN